MTFVMDCGLQNAETYIIKLHAPIELKIKKNEQANRTFRGSNGAFCR